MPDSSLSVLLETEGTYPYAGGGVSTWCHTLCRLLDDVDFTLFAVTGTPTDDSHSKYDLPPNVRSVRTLPLWGSLEPSVDVRPDMPFSEVYVSRLHTTPAVVKRHFLPPFKQVLRSIVAPEGVTRSDGAPLYALYRFFQTHDYKQAFRAQGTWDAFVRIVLSAPALQHESPSLADAATPLRWLYHFLLPLNTDLPKTDLTHATATGTCGLPSIVAYWAHGTPMIVTDHGVYLRERYLAVSDTDLPFVQKWFLTHLSHYIARLCYHTAALVAPVCRHNRRWEERLGTDPAKIRTIYNGIATDDFAPAPKPAHVPDRPTVVAAAHLFPLKDIETMIRSCAVAREQVPNVQYRVYGSLDVDAAYTARCRDLIRTLDLNDHFVLGGFHDTPTELYHEGDISILSSISEGFPYAVIEAMACGRPVVATDVGGVREAIADCGVVVPPRDANALGQGVAGLLSDPDRRARLSTTSRARVLDKFRLSEAARTYREVYHTVARSSAVRSPFPSASSLLTNVLKTLSINRDS
jgi:glycosyltransferase involved in cell wall biosynthesis